MGKGPPGRPFLPAVSPPVGAAPPGDPLEPSATTPKRKPQKIRYHDAEWARVVAHARECGKPPATYVRDVSLGAVPKARRNRTENQLILELGRIGNNLNQLARLAHSRGELPAQEQLEAALGEVLAAVRRIG